MYFVQAIKNWTIYFKVLNDKFLWILPVDFGTRINPEVLISHPVHHQSFDPSDSWWSPDVFIVNTNCVGYQATDWVGIRCIRTDVLLPFNFLTFVYSQFNFFRPS